LVRSLQERQLFLLLFEKGRVVPSVHSAACDGDHAWSVVVGVCLGKAAWLLPWRGTTHGDSGQRRDTSRSEKGHTRGQRRDTLEFREGTHSRSEKGHTRVQRRDTLEFREGTHSSSEKGHTRVQRILKHTRMLVSTGGIRSLQHMMFCPVR
jgi:hypothetical protein